MNHPFWKARKQYQRGRTEFSRFVYSEQLTLLDDFQKEDQRGILSKWYTFYVSAPKDKGKAPYINNFSSILKIQSGKGSTGRYDVDGKWILESGLTLTYSFGFSGEVAVILYPFLGNDNNWRPEEDNLLIAVVPSDVNKLRKRVKKDLRAMIAYGHVTALDGRPKISDKMLVYWLRFTCGRNVENKWQAPKRVEVISKSIASAGSGVISGTLRFLTPIVLAYLLLKFGFDIQGR